MLVSFVHWMDWFKLNRIPYIHCLHHKPAGDIGEHACEQTSCCKQDRRYAALVSFKALCLHGNLSSAITAT